MRYRKTEIWKSVDWITILLYLIMVIAGWFSICGASYEFDNVGLFDPSGRPGMQMIWIGTSLALIFVTVYDSGKKSCKFTDQYWKRVL